MEILQGQVNKKRLIYCLLSNVLVQKISKKVK